MPIIDAYAHVGNQGSNASGYNDQPPTAAPPGGGKDSVLQFYVPAENTIVDLGAGKTPGIRMITNTHAHLGTVGPLTTFSLGLSGGTLPSGGVSGLNLYTEANKKETIQCRTDETYVGESHILYATTKEETVRDVWTETGNNAKTETIKGTVTQNFNSEHNLNVGKASVYEYKGAKKESIGTADGGDYTLTIGGNKTEHVKKTLTVHVAGEANYIYDGEVNILKTKKTKSTLINNEFAISSGIKTAGHDGLKIGLNSLLSVSVDNVVAGKAAVKSTVNVLNLAYNAVNIAKNSFSTQTSTIVIIK